MLYEAIPHFSDFWKFVRRPGEFVTFCVGKQYGKPFATITGDKIFRTEARLLDDRGNLAQAIISLQVTIIVVIGFEMIDEYCFRQDFMCIQRVIKLYVYTAGYKELIYCLTF